ncbi:MAG TPA: two-component regulator propeller domain-containing protein, partial [Abditibacteriaceae bacterium]
MKFRLLRTVQIGAAIGCALALCLPRAAQTQNTVSPPLLRKTDGVFTSTRQINALLLAKDGHLWVATSGGVMRRSAGGKWRKWTRAQGLPSHEIHALQWRDNTLTAVTPHGAAVLHGDLWRAKANTEKIQTAGASKEFVPPSPTAVLKGVRYTAVLDELIAQTQPAQSAQPAVGADKTEQRLPLPPSRGTHITALLARRDSLLVGVYGDGLWRFDGAAWKRVPKFPDAAREVTALAGNETGTLYLGTRRGGLWQLNKGVWKQTPGA